MAANVTIVSPPPLQALVAGEDGKTTKSWAIWYRDMHASVAKEASETTPGLVKQMETVADAVDSSAVTVAQVVIDLNAAIAVLNDLLAKSKAAGQMTT